ncbi:MAG: phasin family protein [Bradyrhizobium sp.]
MVESADENQPIPHSRKAEQRNRTPDQQRKQKPDRQKRLKPGRIDDANAQIDVATASSEFSPPGTLVGSPDLSPRQAAIAAMELHEAAIASMEPYADEAAITPTEPPPREAAASRDAAPVNFRTIADAYRDYTRRSLQETASFAEQLGSARSLAKAMEIQTEFAKQAYATFVMESLTIGELYRQQARQMFGPLANLMTSSNKTAT